MDVEQKTGSGGVSTELTREPSLASPPPSIQPPPDSLVEDKEQVSASLDRKCAPSQAPMTASTNYDQLFYGQLHELCKQRGYHQKDATAVFIAWVAARRMPPHPWTRLDSMDAVYEKNAEGSPREMDASMSVLGKRTRNRAESMDIGTAVGGNREKCHRSEALEIVLTADSEEEKGAYSIAESGTQSPSRSTSTPSYGMGGRRSISIGCGRMQQSAGPRVVVGRRRTACCISKAC